MANFDPNAAASPDSGVFGLPHTPDEAALVLIPVPFEATTSYGGGTVDGPNAILEASKQVDLFDIETGRPYERGIAMIEEPANIRRLNEEAKELAKPIVAAGGIGDDAVLRTAAGRVNKISDEVNAWVYQQAKSWLAKGKKVGAVGGDHSISFGNIQAHAEKYPGMGILHLDAHADLRDAYEGFAHSHASIFHNVMTRLPNVAKLVQVGIRDLGDAEHQMIQKSQGRIVTHFDAHLSERKFNGESWNKIVADIVSALPKQVYLSFDIDGLDPTLCPHTGTPVPGGLSFQEAAALIGGVVKSGRQIVGFDLTEVAPDPEGSEWDGNVGARLLYKMIGWALKG
ncbi:MAG: agmatinase family protein [Myxococcaceae bacterium]